MPTIAESLPNQSQLSSSLKAGLDVIDRSQVVTFTKYVKVVLPIDGFVFWVKADLLSPSALLNAAALNFVAFNEPQAVITPAPTIKVQGSLHYATDHRQNEDETVDVDRVVFTSESEIRPFNEIGPMVMFIGEFDGLRIVFSQRQSFYQQAGIYHYAGDAVYPAMESQIIDDPQDFDARTLVVSNSLPIWLSLSKFMPVYPSFAVPDNTVPPYATAHIPPDSTEAIQAAPSFDRYSTHSQLVKEKVRITIYGLRNFNALDFQDYVFQYSLDTDVIGVMNMPVIRDEKRTQAELTILAMKKSIEFEVNYYQTRARDVARQLILSCIPTFILGD